MIAVLNSLRAEKGKPTMGFLNTWLYKLGRLGFTEYVNLPFAHANKRLREMDRLT